MQRLSKSKDNIYYRFWRSTLQLLESSTVSIFQFARVFKFIFAWQVVFSERSKNFFSFDCGPLVSYPSEADGWEVYETEEELKRIFKVEDSEEIIQHGWRISTCNIKYELCPTYPMIFCVPSNVSDQNLEKVAQFRSSGRIPILSWFDSSNSATISRSSQPRVGLSGRERNAWDENLLEGISSSNKIHKTVFLMDARPKLNAVANQANKGGFENTNAYNDAQLEFLGYLRFSLSFLNNLFRYREYPRDERKSRETQIRLSRIQNVVVASS